MYSKLFLIAVFAPLFAAAQNVGVGTTTPTSRLHVVDSSANVRLLLQGLGSGNSRAAMELIAGSNTFNYLQIAKYPPVSFTSVFGVSADNLSVIQTGGNGGGLLLGTGDGVSPLLFATGTAESMRITANGKVGIGTATPSIQNRLHVHNADPSLGVDVSIGISNSVTTDANGRGARLRMLGNDFGIMNNELTGRLTFSTNSNQRLVITPTGNIGINNLNPAYLLDIETNSSSRAVNINQTGSSSSGLDIRATGGGTNNRGIFISNPANSSLPSNYAIGVHAISGSGSAISLSPTTNYGLIGECRNPAEGYGVLGISNAPSPLLIQAGVVGVNFSTAASSYGVIGNSNGSSGAGTVGYTDNATVGLLGFAYITSTGPAIKSVSLAGSSGIGLELENGAIKVSGTNRTVFRHVATAGNTGGNETIIPNTTLANSATDLLIVTPFWDGVYLNAAIGVYFEATSGTWRIFRQDFGNIPLNAKFNVMVIKQ
jgi:hypothetical protein